MGKKGSWFSAIKRVFVHNSKEKPINELESKNRKETQKNSRGKKYGDTKSFIPTFREPSSIEEILGEIDEQKLLIRPLTPFELPKTPSLPTPKAASPKSASPKAVSPKAAFIHVASPKAYSKRVASPKAASSRNINNRHKEVIRYRPEPTLQYQHLSATKIQSAYRGYMARRSFRGLRGLVRLQGVVKGQNVKRQTGNAMKMMQLMVRVQTQIQSRRIQMLENQARKNQFEKEFESTLGKWAFRQSAAGNQEDWDDSTLTKEEREARMEKKMEALLKRERAMAYAYAHQTSKSNLKSAQSPLPDFPPDGFPWWRNWIQRQLPDTNNLPDTQSVTTLNNLTPPRRTPNPKPSPRRPPSTHKSPPHHTFDQFGSTTPTSTRSMAPLRSKHFMHKTPPRHSSGTIKFPKTFVKDDDSLTSCPPFLGTPNYMTPTASAKAKARASSNPKERFPVTPVNDLKKRFSFPLTPNIGPFKWSKGSSKKEKNVTETKQCFEFPGDFNVDSAVSTPAAGGRKPFNRFV